MNKKKELLIVLGGVVLILSTLSIIFINTSKIPFVDNSSYLKQSEDKKLSEKMFLLNNVFDAYIKENNKKANEDTSALISNKIEEYKIEKTTYIKSIGTIDYFSLRFYKRCENKCDTNGFTEVSPNYYYIDYYIKIKENSIIYCDIYIPSELS